MEILAGARSDRDYYTKNPKKYPASSLFSFHPVDYVTWKIVGAFIEFLRENDVVMSTLSRQAYKAVSM